MADEMTVPSMLPLIFAGGYPTSLERLTEAQLEKFIPFMIKCSMGKFNNNDNAECSEPEWWPESVPFSIPLRRPTCGTDWMEKLKSIVKLCYDFHGSEFLLKFCQDLSERDPESLRFIGNYNNTTSLWNRSSNKLLVTIMNANLLYDQAPVERTSKMTLMPTRKNKSLSDTIDKVVERVETVFEVYLCDNCEAELYSQDAYDEHEKTCLQNIIFGGNEFLTDPLDNTLEEQTNFLANLSLVNPKLPLPNQLETPVEKCEEQPSIVGVKRSRFRCSKMALDSSIPFSSLAGQHLLKLSKIHLPPGYAMEKLERTERYCHAPPITCNNLDDVIQPIKYKRIPVTYRRPPDHTYRHYTYPRRQFSQHRYRQAFLELNNDQLKQCKPITIELMKLSTNCKETIDSDNRYEKMTKTDGMATNQPATTVINLCSDDDNDENFSNSHHDDGNIAQMAATPVSSSSLTETWQRPFEIYAMTQRRESMSNSDINEHNESSRDS